jgi:hypothetical protein
MIYLKETFVSGLLWPSKLLNWVLGGSINEYYCSRIYRERKNNQIIILNWVFFFTTGDISHCRRVNEQGNKK